MYTYVFSFLLFVSAELWLGKRKTVDTAGAVPGEDLRQGHMGGAIQVRRWWSQRMK